MKKVAITGGIGSGKSYVSNKFAKLGVPIYNSDDRANIIMSTNINVKASMINNFGNDCYIGDELNKKLVSKNNIKTHHFLQSTYFPFI